MLETEEQRSLAAVIRQWNSSRPDLFEMSEPDENLEFFGVVRFHLEDRAADSVTKCLRVSSRAGAREVIRTLSEKFRPDMKMLTSAFWLHEVHGGEERRLDPKEKPLLVQLNWTADNREGRFVLRRDGPILETNGIEKKQKGGMIENFKRTLSKKEKKKINRKEADENGLDSTHQRFIGRSPENNQNSAQRRPPAPAVGLKLVPLRLPVEIQFPNGCEEAFISAVVNYTNSSTVHFKLSPAYALYAAARSALRSATETDKTNTVTAITNKMVAMTENVIQKQQTIAGTLSFWLANTSELLNFLQQDRGLGPLTGQTQQELALLVHTAYRYLMQCLQSQLRKRLPTFFLDPEQHGPLPAGIEMVLSTLVNTAALLRRARVNPALSIQLFSQLFHYTSAWLLNRLLDPRAGPPGLRSHYWGAALRQRLGAVRAWAERQGLELAADCHLGLVVQATTLLTMDKYSTQDAEALQKTCFKLNSLQLHTLLTGYLYAPDEPRIPPALIDSVVAAARRSADPLVASEGRSLEREESLELHLPFLLPDGGYSCDTVGGVPLGFSEFLEPICRKGLCKLTLTANRHTSWKVFFSEPGSPTTTSHVPRQAACGEPEVVGVTLRKPPNSGMGVSIVAAKGSGQDHIGIYVKSVVKGGPAEMDGTLSVGDQLLSVDGQSLVGLHQERAALIMVRTGPVVTLQVAKHAASCHGLETLIKLPFSAPNAGDRAPTTREVQARDSRLGLGTDQGNQPVASNRRRQSLQRNRMLYHSNPNMSDCVEDGTAPVYGGASYSTLNLCTEGSGQDHIGIYVKSVVKGGPAEMDGTLSVGDQLLSVDGQSLVGLHQERAALIMVRTGPVVTLQVAKHAASCHGLETLIKLPFSAPNAGDRAPTTREVQARDSRLGLGTDQGNQPVASSRRRQSLQRNRMLYHSNPNMSDCVEDGTAPVYGGASYSTLNLCTETFHREYMTLHSSRHPDHGSDDQSQQMLRISLGPAAQKQNPNMRTFMRQAQSQENLSLEPPPLAGPPQNPTSFLRPSVSMHSLLSEPENPSRPQNLFRPKSPAGPQSPEGQGVKSGAGVWRTPPSKISGPSPSNQPIRIDIPVARSGAPPRPVLSTFQHRSVLSAVRAAQTGPRPVSSTSTPSQLQQNTSPSQSQRTPCRAQAGPPAPRHVSFQNPLPVQDTPPRQGNTPPKQENTSPLPSEGPSLDPWRQEEQGRQVELDLLERKVKELGACVCRTPGESERLRRLTLELQFQRRLKEMQENGEEEDDDNFRGLVKEPQTANLSEQGQSRTPDHNSIGLDGASHEVVLKKRTQEEVFPAPEKLPFKDRQCLFSLGSDSPVKVKALQMTTEIHKRPQRS